MTCEILREPFGILWDPTLVTDFMGAGVGNCVVVNLLNSKLPKFNHRRLL